jgi:hypothetical protein
MITLEWLEEAFGTTTKRSIKGLFFSSGKLPIERLIRNKHDRNQTIYLWVTVEPSTLPLCFVKKRKFRGLRE